MKEPAIFIATGAGSAAAWGVGELLGVPGGALIAGLAGAVAFTLLARPKSKGEPNVGYFIALGAAIIGSTLVAGYMAPFSAPVVGALTAALVPTDAMPPETALRAHAFLWGAGAQVLLKTAIESARRRIEQVGGKDQP